LRGKQPAITKTILMRGGAVAYTIEWRRTGAIKHFTDTVSFEDVMQSESDISGSERYSEIWYVVCDFSGTQGLDMTDSQRQQIRALRLGGFWSNPRIKFAFVTVDLNVQNAIEKSVFDGQTLHATQVFKTMEDAMAWATVL
jgi:hypothetical protein